jgi:hypothetical protein
MRAHFQWIVAQWSKLGDTSKLCFLAATSFAAFGAAGTATKYFLSWETDIHAFYWISVFYTSLGIVEQWNPSRPDGRHVIIPFREDVTLEDVSSNHSKRNAA